MSVSTIPLDKGRSVSLQTSVIVVGGGPVGLGLPATLGQAVPLRVIVDTFAGERAAYRRRFILVRPDQYAAWTGNELPADPTTLLRRVIGGAAQ